MTIRRRTSAATSVGGPGRFSKPYFSLVDFDQALAEGPVRREILMVSDGIDRFGGADPVTLMWTPPLKKRSARGLIYSIYTPGVGHYGHSFWR